MLFETQYENMETRERILAVAMEMFFSMEYSKVTLKAIAEAAGVTKGGIYHYFDSKDHLLSEAISFSFTSIMSQMDSLLDENQTAKEIFESWFDFRKMMGSYAEVFTGEQSAEYMMQFMYLMFTAIRKSPDIKKQFSKIYSETIDQVEKLLIRAQENGEIRSELNPKGIAIQLVTSFEGATLLGSIIDGYDLDSLGKGLFETFWNQVKAI